MRLSRNPFRSLTFIDFSISLVLLGLLCISAYATYEGIHDLILAEQPEYVKEGWQRYYIMGAVGLLTLAMWVLLEVALRRGSAAKRSVSALVYVVLALWSIGFGYGFWWKVIASRADTASNIDAVVGLVSDQVERAERSVTQLENDLSAILKKSAEKQTEEDAKGSSCGVTSGTGRGTFFRLRSDVTVRAQNIHGRITQQWITPLKTQVGQIEGHRKTIADPGVRGMAEDKRRELFRGTYEMVRKSGNIMQDLSADLGPKFSNELTKFAADLSVRPGADKSTCYDPALASALTDAAKGAGRPIEFKLPDFAVNEGAAATVFAFNKVWGNVFWLLDKGLSRVGLSEGLSIPKAMQGRDIIALVAAIVVDICIFVFAAIRSRRPLDASHLFQSAENAARKKLVAAIRAFEGDDAVDARRVFDGCILRDGSNHYFILPSLASPLAPAWRPGAAFLQNILVVLEEVRAVDKSYDHIGIAARIRNRMPWFGMKRQFEKAAAQLSRFGWSEIAKFQNVEPQNGTATLAAIDVSLHRLRRTDLLEILLLVRQAGSDRDTVKMAKTSSLNRPAADASVRKPEVIVDEPRVSLKDLMLSQVSKWRGGKAQDTASARVASPHVHATASQAGYEQEVAPETSGGAHGGQGNSWWRAGWRRKRIASAQRMERDADQSQDIRPDLLRSAASERGASNANDQNLSPSLRDVLGQRRGKPLAEGRPQQQQPETPARLNSVPTERPGGAADNRHFTANGPVQSSAETSGSTTPDTREVQKARDKLEAVFSQIDSLNLALEDASGDPNLSSEVQAQRSTLEEMLDNLDGAGLEPSIFIDDVVTPGDDVEIQYQSSNKPAGSVLRVLVSGYRDKASGQAVRKARIVASDGSASNKACHDVSRAAE